jgi:hypothetical protein
MLRSFRVPRGVVYRNLYKDLPDAAPLGVLHVQQHLSSTADLLASIVWVWILLGVAAFSKAVE